METPVIENSQTEAAIKESPFLTSMGDALKNAQTEAQAKQSKTAAPVDPTPAKVEAHAPAPAAEKSEKKDSLPAFEKKEELAKSAPTTSDLDAPPGLSEKSAVHWKKIKDRVELAEKKAAELESKLTTANPNRVLEIEAKLKAIEAEKLEMSDRLKLLAIERHPEFSKKYETKTSQVHAQLKSVAGADGDKLVSLLSAPESPLKAQEIDNIVAGLTPSQQSKFGALMVKLEDINSERSAEIESAKQNFETFKESILGQQSAKSAESKVKAQQIWDKVSAEARALELFEPKDGDEKWNTEVNERLQTAQQIFSGESGEEDLAKAALWAASAPKYREIVYSQGALINQLKAELAAYKETSPEVNSSSPSGKVEPDTFMEKMTRALRTGKA